tara:strand:- start:1791 stop:2228 length:438 start_codon:yes stop_codon:yes gene_type:complete
LINHTRFRIIAFGKVQKEWIKAGISLYRKRLPGLIIIELRESNPKQELRSIKLSIKKNEKLIILNERGTFYNSIDFSKELIKHESSRLVFLIGGADGIPPEILSLPHDSLSLSQMTFPHDIARLLLLEQIYRACSISQGKPYHRS